MKLGKVIGNVVSTKKEEKLMGLKLLTVELLHTSKKEVVVAADKVGAGIGDVVIVTLGSASSAAFEKPAPIDAVVVGIVDNL